MQDRIRQAISAAREARASGDVRTARNAYARAADLARSAGERGLLAHALRHISELARESGDLTQALSAGKEAVALYRAEPNAKSLDLANALRVNALALGASEPPSDPAYLWREARELHVNLGIEDAVAECDEHLAESGAG